MADVSSLDMFTWLFQIFGFQFFSLKNLEKEGKERFPPRWQWLLAAFWIVLITVLIVLIENDFEERKETKNILRLVVRCVNYVNTNVAIYYCLILTFF